MRSEVNIKGRCKTKLTVPNGRWSRITVTLCAINAREAATCNANEKSSWSDRYRDRLGDEQINPRRRNNMKNEVTISNRFQKIGSQSVPGTKHKRPGRRCSERKMHVEHAGQTIGFQARKIKLWKLRLCNKTWQINFLV